MYPPIFSVCYADSSVTALLGTSPCRLYPFGEGTQKPAKPYAVWQTVGGSPENYINDLPDCDTFLIQVDVYADTAASARSVAVALRDAIEPEAHVTSWRGESKDPETGNYRSSFTVSWIVRR